MSTSLVIKLSSYQVDYRIKMIATKVIYKIKANIFDGFLKFYVFS